MDNFNKIRISYEELNDPQIDQIIFKKQNNKKIVIKKYGQLYTKFYIHRVWTYLFMLALIAALIIWYLASTVFKESPTKNNLHYTYTSTFI